MATNIQMRDFIALVTGGFVPLRDLIVAGQQIGLNASDAVEVITQLQPAMTPGNIMSNSNMTSADPSTYVEPRIGFEEAVDFYDVPETMTPALEYDFRVDPGEIGTGYFKDEFEEQNLDYNVGTGTPGEKGRLIPLQMPDPYPVQVSPTNRLWVR